jgi:hypothetical protein
MRQLNNTQEDKLYLSTLLPIKATITTGYFASDKVDSLQFQQTKGEIIEIDIPSGYIEWKHELGHMMPSVNINCVTLN